MRVLSLRAWWEEREGGRKGGREEGREEGREGGGKGRREGEKHLKCQFLYTQTQNAINFPY